MARVKFEARNSTRADETAVCAQERAAEHVTEDEQRRYHNTHRNHAHDQAVFRQRLASLLEVGSVDSLPADVCA